VIGGLINLKGDTGRELRSASTTRQDVITYIVLYGFISGAKVSSASNYLCRPKPRSR